MMRWARLIQNRSQLPFLYCCLTKNNSYIHSMQMQMQPKRYSFSCNAIFPPPNAMYGLCLSCHQIRISYKYSSIQTYFELSVINIKRKINFFNLIREIWFQEEATTYSSSNLKYKRIIRPKTVIPFTHFYLYLRRKNIYNA